MTNVRLLKDSQGWRGFSAFGHADYDEEGYDIVCAAVSVLLQTTYLGLERVVELPVTMTMQDGFFSCRWRHSPELAASTRLLMDTLAEGLNEMQKAYANNIQVMIEEVE